MKEKILLQVGIVLFLSMYAFLFFKIVSLPKPTDNSNEIINQSIEVEKTYRTKVLLETHEIIWGNTKYCIDNNEQLLLNPETIKLVSILEGIDEFTNDELDEVRLGTIDVWTSNLEVAYKDFLDLGGCDVEYQEPHYTSCNLFELLDDIGKALDDGYTYDFVDGVMIEYRYGIANGDKFTEDQVIDEYCNIGTE